MMNSLFFPPVVPKSLTPIEINKDGDMEIKIPYQVPAGSEEYTGIRAKVTDQISNQLVSNKNKYPDGLIKKSNIENQTFTINFAVDLNIENNINLEGKILKIQLSFYNETQDNASNINTIYSEWSNVILVKFIKLEKYPVVMMRGAGLFPVFAGSYAFTENSKENQYYFYFEIYDGQTLYEKSPLLLHNNQDNTIDEYQITKQLETKEYLVKYKTISQNGFEQEVSRMFSIFEIEHIDNNFGTLEIVPNYEEGVFDIYFGSESLELGTILTLKRSSELSNFTNWEKIYVFPYNNIYINDTLIYQDFTIESGIEYKYALQQSNEQLSQMVIDTPVCIYLQHSYLYGLGKHNEAVQLKLPFNNKMSSFKHTLQKTKQDTIGGRFPVIITNGNAFYAEFPITGLISLHQDSSHTFFALQEDGYYYQGEKIIPINKLQGIDFNTNLTQENIFIERKFREKVEEFLYDNSFKLYRSPTEGNFIVAIMNVSFSPNETLGRMISEFNATAYEVAEFNYENLNKYFNLYDLNKEIDKFINLQGQIIINTDSATTDGKVYFKDCIEISSLYNEKDLIINSYTIETDQDVTINNSGNDLITSNGFTIENPENTYITKENLAGKSITISWSGTATLANVNKYNNTAYVTTGTVSGSILANNLKEGYNDYLQQIIENNSLLSKANYVKLLKATINSNYGGTYTYNENQEKIITNQNEILGNPESITSISSIPEGSTLQYTFGYLKECN